ncbi:MAG: DnaJ domain-containing protein [Oscillospiraceae bacterium]
MNNPYSVLGVSENATDEQIKDAYRNLARKYQTSEYGANPLSDIAASKLAELDRAYDEIMMSRRGQTNYQATYSNADYTSDQSQYPDVRAKINANRIDDAETILDGIPKDVRNAEWYYLKGQIQQKRGWFDEAYKNYS